MKLFIITALIFFIITPVLAKEVIPGPVPATIIKVTDGDTMKVQAQIWPGHFVVIKVRLAGIDTPEPRGKCQQEKDLAREAKQFVLKIDKAISLTNIYLGKYAGRIIANVRTKNGNDLTRLLINNGLGRDYYGGKRQGWCEGISNAVE
jgi:endonuclease YncB( thermonuclease family)